MQRKRLRQGFRGVYVVVGGLPHARIIAPTRGRVQQCQNGLRTVLNGIKFPRMFDGVLTLAHNGPVALSCPNSGNSTKGSPYSPSKASARSGEDRLRAFIFSFFSFLSLESSAYSFFRVVNCTKSVLSDRLDLICTRPVMSSSPASFQHSAERLM